MNEDYYWDYGNSTMAGRYLDSQERAIINRFLGKYSPRLCLDIACGSGRFSLSLMERGIPVISSDCDPIPIKKLHNRVQQLQNRKKSISVLRTNAENMPFKDKTFDCILSVQTIAYLDVPRFFFECNRVLQDGGYLLFNEANRHSYKSVIQHKIGSGSHFYRHSYSEICSMLLESGFCLRKSSGMNWLPITRNSNNRGISFASKLESTLKMRLFPSISPWVFFIAQKKSISKDSSFAMEKDFEFERV